ncbi:hypothetical protein [Spirochaeta africana]|nr:hypothetical protein [Spirochaeta africana]
MNILWLPLRTLLRLPNPRRTWLLSGDQVIDDFLAQVEPGLVGSMRVRDAALSDICRDLTARRDRHPMAGSSPVQAARTACAAAPDPQHYARRQRRTLLRRWLLSGLGYSAVGMGIIVLMFLYNQGDLASPLVTAAAIFPTAAVAGCAAGLLLGYIQAFCRPPADRVSAGDGWPEYTVGSGSGIIQIVAAAISFGALLQILSGILHVPGTADPTPVAIAGYTGHLILVGLIIYLSWPDTHSVRVSRKTIELHTPWRTYTIPRSNLQAIEPASLLCRALLPWCTVLRISWQENSGKNRSRVVLFNRRTDLLDRLQGETASSETPVPLN